MMDSFIEKYKVSGQMGELHYAPLQGVVGITLAHSLHQLVFEQPGTAVGDAKLALECRGADGVLVLGYQIHGQEPQAQWQWQWQFGVLHHGAHNAGALVAANKALPQLAPSAIAGEKVAFAATVRAVPAAGPAGGNHCSLALLLAAVEGQELRQWQTTTPRLIPKPDGVTARHISIRVSAIGLCVVALPIFDSLQSLVNAFGSGLGCRWLAIVVFQCLHQVGSHAF